MFFSMKRLTGLLVGFRVAELRNDGNGFDACSVLRRELF